MQFMRFVLTEIGGSDFESFSKTLYLVRNELNLEDKFHSFVVCLKCHKLYNKQEVKNFQQNEQLLL